VAKAASTAGEVMAEAVSMTKEVVAKAASTTAEVFPRSHHAHFLLFFAKNALREKRL